MPSNSSSTIVPVRRRNVTVTTTATGSTTSDTVSISHPNWWTVSKSKSWVNTPNYRSLVAAGAPLPDNTLFYSKSSRNSGGSTASYVNRYPAYTQSINLSWNIAPVAGTTPTSPVIDYNPLNRSLIDKAKGNQWNVPVFLAEAKKTVDLVERSAKFLAQAAFYLRSGRFDNFYRLLFLQPPPARAKRRFGRRYAKDPQQAFSSTWLEYHYGWVPMHLDCYNAMNTLMDTAERPDAKIATIKGHVPRFFPEVVSPQAVILDDPLIRVFGITTSTTRIVYKASWRCSMKPEDVPGRFGLVNPAEVVWELVPLSFVVDWFFPIGDYLSSLDVSLRFNHHGGSRGYKITRVASVRPTITSPAHARVTGFKASSSIINVYREGMGMPSVALQSAATFDPYLTATRLTSAFALLSQAFRPFRKR